MNMPNKTFGDAVKDARQEHGHTLRAMSREMGIPASTLSAMENRRNKVTNEVINKIYDFYHSIHYESKYDLYELAAVANNSVDLDGLNPQQQMLVASFASTELSQSQIENFRQLLSPIKKKNKQDDTHEL